MYELERTDEVERLIKITKSDSGVSGPKLVKAHIRLGELLGEHIVLDPLDTTIVAMMRGGIFFAQGMYMTMGCKFQTYDPKHETFLKPKTSNIIIVDSVINSGKTIKPILSKNMLVASCVINEQVINEFKNQLYTVRVSKNSFVGSEIRKQHGKIGPDTTMRLFNEI